MIPHTLTFNLWAIRVHEFIAREISLLQSESPSLWISTSSMQRLQADLEHPHKETRSQALAQWPGFVGSRFGARAIAEESDAAHGPDPTSNGTPLASGPAAVCVPSSGFALAQRPLGFGLGWTLFSLSSHRLGLVCDGAQTLPSKSLMRPPPVFGCRCGSPKRRSSMKNMVSTPN